MSPPMWPPLLVGQNGFELPIKQPIVLDEFALRAVVDQTKFVLIQSISGSLALDSSVTRAILDVVSSTGIGFRESGESGIPEDTDVHIDAQSGSVERHFVCCTRDAIRQEYINLSAAADEYLAWVKSNSLLVPDDAKRLKLIYDLSSENYRSFKSVQLVLGRRLIRYSLLPDGILDEDQASRLFFDEYIESASMMIPAAERDSLSSNVLKDAYKGSHTALRLLRQQAWAPVLFSTLEIDTRAHPFFYGLYRAAVTASSVSGSHTITFSRPNDPHLEDQLIQQGFGMAFRAGKSVLRSIQ